MKSKFLESDLQILWDDSYLKEYIRLHYYSIKSTRFRFIPYREIRIRIRRYK